MAVAVVQGGWVMYREGVERESGRVGWPWLVMTGLKM